MAAAAQAGHAAAVSILLTFGVNPGGRGVANRGVLHIVGRNSDQSAPLQLRILRHFIGGLEVAGKADSFNGWNDVEDIGRPLDALHAYGSSVEGENVTVIYEMAGLLRERGARCSYRTSDRTQRVCVGSANVSLVTALSAAVRDRSVSAASVRAAAAAVAGTDIPLDDLDGGGGGIVAAAAQAGHAAAVSILLTFGVNPGGRGVANRGVLHIVGRNSDQSAPLQLRILRHFIGGLEVAGKADSFNGWNDVEDIGRPLDALHAYGSSVEKDHASKREMQALLYERGASCGAPEGKIYCQIPSEFVLVPSGAPLTGPVLTVTATRRAVGGTPFGFALPDAGARARLNAQGWEMSLAAGPPAGVVLSRTQAAGGLPTVAVTMLNGERAVRELRVALQSDFEYVEGDQCAAPFSPPVCDAAAVCVDPDLESANTPAELCVCTDDAAEGNGLFCGHDSVNGRLLAEVKKPAGAARVSVVLTLLGLGANASVADENGAAALILAATAGHAEIVSVLVTAGADVKAADPGFYNMDAVQHLATPLSDPAAGPRALRASVLRHFIGGLDVRSALFGRADFDWNREDSRRNRALDLLVNATNKLTLEGENVTVIYEMAGLLRERGARCGYRTSDRTQRVCVGSANVSLVTALSAAVRDRSVSAASVRAAAAAVAGTDIPLDDLDGGGGGIVAAAAQAGHAAAVSILLTFGVNPGGRGVANRGVLHIVGRNSDQSAPLQLRILRHFIGGLEVAGKADSFNGWNDVEDIGRPLDALHAYGSSVEKDHASKREMQALLYERGASCGAPEGKIYCQIPSEFVLVPSGAPLTGPVLTVTATRRAVGGTPFGFALPDAGARARLNAQGWEMSLAAGPPAGVVLSRTQAAGGLPTVAVTMLNGERAVRELRVALQSDFEYVEGDQCAAPFSPPVCDAAAVCVDPDLESANTPAELCVCTDDAAEGNGLFCGHESVNGRLLAEVKKPAGAARVSVVLTLLGLGANASVADENGAAALILAATAGHAEIVSVLVTAGADVKAADPGFYNMDAVQHLATPLSDPAAGPRALRASVLRHFIGGLDVRNTLFGGADFDWNREDSRRNRALDLLVNATNKLTLEGENVTVIYEMAGLLRERGARCGYRTSDRTQRVCVGSANVSLVTALSAAVRDRSVSAASVRAAAAAVAGTDIPLDDLDGGGGGIVAAAAQAGHAAAVSILLTFGVNPGGRGVANRGVLHIVGRNSDQSAPLQLRILRHFIGGLEVAGKADSFNGWNDVEDIGRPLDALHAYGSSVEKDHVSKREMQALLYERGASCGAPEGKIYCQIPSEFVLVPSGAPLTGPVLTVTATRRAVGGTPFGFALPDAGARARLNAQGWEMSLAAGPPAGVVLSRTQAAGGLPTVAVTMLNGERAVRELRVALQSDFEYVVGDQCAAPFSPPVCDAAAVCVDPDLESTNTPAELCVCTDDAAEGNGLFCGHESVNGRLLAEVKKPAGAARVSLVLTLLGLGANASVADENGAAALILAATAGHAEIVSVLVTAGADVKAADPGFYNMDAVQHLATPLSDPAAGPRALRASVLRHFIGGLDVRSALFGRVDFDWNREDSRRNRALDLLVNATNKLTLEGENVTVIYEMAGLLRERGARCGYRTSDRTQRVCVGSANVSLVTALSAAVRDRSVSAASVRAAAAAVAGTDIPLDDLDGGGGGIVAAAAQAGHAAAVSILLTFGVNPGGRGVANRGVLHIVGRNSDQSAPLQLRILRHFIGGLEVAGKADSFNGWNDVEDIGRPLDALHAYGSSVEGENVTVIYEMAGLLRERGARCSYRTADRTQRVCVGSANVSLVTALSAAVRDRSVSAASVRAAAAAVAGTDIPLDDLDGGGGGIVAAAAQAGHAAAVSILLTFGVNPGGRGVANRGVLHIVGRNSDQSAPLQLRILRHFIGGLEVAGKADSFNGWNDVEDIGRPLEALHAYGSSVEKDHASKREMQALLYERGASCGAPEGKIYCQIPSEFVLVPSGAPLTGPVLTVTATRRAVGGTPFGFALPDAGARARLNAQGWEMSLAAGPPAGVVLSRTQAAGGLPTVAVTMLNGERAVRELRVALESDFEGDQCAAPFSPPVCDAAAVCVDPDMESTNTPAELCVCTDDAAEGNGLFCGHESVNGRLLAEVKKPAGAARVSVVLTLLGLGANASVADENGAAALILAATAGHAEIVSVLVTAGADVKAADSGFYNLDAVQHLATPLSDPAAGPRALRASVLRHFIGGLDVRSALFGRVNFDWNREDSRRNRALDLLVNATAKNKLALEGEDEDIIYEMADAIHARGGRCGHRTADHGRRICNTSPLVEYAVIPSDQSGGTLTAPVPSGGRHCAGRQ